MFQDFETRSARDQGCKRLELLREQMRAQGISVYLVPHADEYQNEYQPEATQRLAWLTGFTGSAGFAIVTMDAAFVFVDSRYTLQAKEQTDSRSATVPWTSSRCLPANGLRKIFAKIRYLVSTPGASRFGSLKPMRKRRRRQALPSSPVQTSLI